MKKEKALKAFLLAALAVITAVSVKLMPVGSNAEVTQTVIKNILTTNFTSSAAIKDDYIKYYDSETAVGENGVRTITFNSSFDVGSGRQVELSFRLPYYATSTGSTKTFNSQQTEIKISNADNEKNYVLFTNYTIASGKVTSGQSWWANAYIDNVKSDYELKPGKSNVGNIYVNEYDTDGGKFLFKFDKNDILSSYFVNTGFSGMFGSLTTEKETFKNVFEGTDRIKISISMKKFDYEWNGGSDGVFNGGRAQIFLYNIDGQDLGKNSSDTGSPYSSALISSRAEYLSGNSYTFRIGEERDLYISDCYDLWSGNNLTYELVLTGKDGNETKLPKKKVSEETTVVFAEEGTYSVAAKIYDEANNLFETNSVNCVVKHIHDYGEWIPEVAADIGEKGFIAHYHCDGCGKNFDSDKNEVESIEIEALNGIKYANLSLEGDIGINFYVYVGGAETLTANNGELTSVETEISGVKLFKFTINVLPKDYKTEVTISIDGYSISSQYSVEKYINKIGTDNEAYNLVQALKDYCEAHKTFFEKAAAEETEDVDVSADNAMKVTGEDVGIALIGSTLILETKTKINIYFTTDDLTDKHFYVDGVEVNPIKAEGYENLYLVSVENIVAKRLSKKYEIKIGGYTINYSALSYVYAVIDNVSSGTAIKNLVKTLYKYSYEADKYFATK